MLQFAECTEHSTRSWNTLRRRWRNIRQCCWDIRAVLFKPDRPFTKQTVASPTEWGEHYERPYSRITSTKSPSFSKTTFSATLTYLMVLLPKWDDCSYQVSRRILAPPPLWPQKHIDVRPHDFACSLDLWHQPRLTAEAGEFVELILLYLWRTPYQTFHRLITLCIL